MSSAELHRRQPYSCLVYLSLVYSSLVFLSGLNLFLEERGVFDGYLPPQFFDAYRAGWRL